MCARLSYRLRMYTILRSNKLSIRNATNFVPKIIDKNTKAGKNFTFEISDKDIPIEVQENVLRIQRELFIVGAELATTKENRKKLEPDKTLVE